MFKDLLKELLERLLLFIVLSSVIPIICVITSLAVLLFGEEGGNKVFTFFERIVYK